jgi:hypothetical protein
LDKIRKDDTKTQLNVKNSGETLEEQRGRLYLHIAILEEIRSTKLEIKYKANERRGLGRP